MVGCNEHDNETSECIKKGKEVPDFQCLPLSLIMDLIRQEELQDSAFFNELIIVIRTDTHKLLRKTPVEVSWP